MLGLAALEGPEAQLLFWGLAGVVFAAVELALGLFLFIAWLDVRGSLETDTAGHGGPWDAYSGYS
jgi:hypothetical protein